MKKKILVTLLLVVVISMLAAFAPAEEEKTVKVCVSWNEKVHSLIQAWQDYMEMYAKELEPETGIKYEWIVNVANGDANLQNNNIADCINQKVDYIVARAQDSGTIGASIKAAEEAGIPFITFDRASTSGEPTAHVGEDGYLQARSTAEAFAALLKEKGVQGKCIELQGDLLDNTAVLRHKAWSEVEKELGAWTTVAEVPTEWKPEKFYQGALNALQANPDANCMYVASDFAFSSVENALSAVDKDAPTGEPNHIWMAADDINPMGYDAMVNGIIDVGTTWEAYSVSVLLVDTLNKMVKGEPFEKENLISGRLATPENVASLEYLYSTDPKYAD